MPGRDICCCDRESGVLVFNDRQVRGRRQGHHRVRIETQFTAQGWRGSFAVLLKRGVKGVDGRVRAVTDFQHSEVAGERIAAPAIPGNAQTRLVESLKGKASRPGKGPHGEKLVVGRSEIDKPKLTRLIAGEKQRDAVAKVFRYVEGPVGRCQEPGLAS